MSIRKLIGDNSEVEIEMEKGSIRDLIKELAHHYGEKIQYEFFDSKTNNLKQYYHILVNGRSYSELPDCLDTQIKDGDVVALFPPVGGG